MHGVNVQEGAVEHELVVCRVGDRIQEVRENDIYARRPVDAQQVLAMIVHVEAHEVEHQVQNPPDEHTVENAVCERNDKLHCETGKGDEGIGPVDLFGVQEQNHSDSEKERGICVRWDGNHQRSEESSHAVDQAGQHRRQTSARPSLDAGPGLWGDHDGRAAEEATEHRESAADEIHESNTRNGVVFASELRQVRESASQAVQAHDREEAERAHDDGCRVVVGVRENVNERSCGAVRDNFGKRIMVQPRDNGVEDEHNNKCWLDVIVQEHCDDECSE